MIIKRGSTDDVLTAGADRQLEPVAGGTKVTRVAGSTAVAEVSIVQQLDEEWQTMELGISTATPLVELRGLQGALVC